jgi:hypothetical protein
MIEDDSNEVFGEQWILWRKVDCSPRVEPGNNYGGDRSELEYLFAKAGRI